MSKNPKQLPNCLRRTETNVLFVFLMMSSVKFPLMNTLTAFYRRST